jgi:hypothetical protein
MQAYMHGTHLKNFNGPRNVKRALYIGVCKDDDAIHDERVRYDKDAAEEIVTRAKSIALNIAPPPRISENPSWYICKMCNAYDLCHGSKLNREINCRTCTHSTASADGAWICERGGAEISEENQRKAYDCHAMHPELTPWEVVSVDAYGRPVFLTEDGEVSDSRRLVKLRVL